MGIEACRTNNTGNLDCHDTGTGGDGDNRVTPNESAGTLISESDFTSNATALRDGGSTNYRPSHIAHQNPAPTSRPLPRSIDSFAGSIEGGGNIDVAGPALHSGGNFRVRFERDFHLTGRLSISLGGSVGGAWRTATVTLPGGENGTSAASGPHVRLDVGGTYYVLDNRALGTLGLDASAFYGATFVDESNQPLRPAGTPPENCMGGANECNQDAVTASNTGLRGIAVVDNNGNIRSLANVTDTHHEVGGRLGVTWTMPWRASRLAVAPFARLFGEVSARMPGSIGASAAEFSAGAGVGIRFGGHLNEAPADNLTRLRGTDLNPDQNAEVGPDGVLRVYVPNTQLGGNSDPTHSAVSVASTLEHWTAPQQLGTDGINTTGVHVSLAPDSVNTRLGIGATYLVRQDSDHVVRPFVITQDYAARFNSRITGNADGSVTLRPLGGLTSFPAGSTLEAIGIDGKPIAARTQPALASTLAQDRGSFNITGGPDGTVGFRVMLNGRPVQQTYFTAAAPVAVPTPPPPTPAPRTAELQRVLANLAGNVVFQRGMPTDAQLGTIAREIARVTLNPNNALIQKAEDLWRQCPTLRRTFRNQTISHWNDLITLTRLLSGGVNEGDANLFNQWATTPIAREHMNAALTASPFQFEGATSVPGSPNTNAQLVMNRPRLMVLIMEKLGIASSRVTIPSSPYTTAADLVAPGPDSHLNVVIGGNIREAASSAENIRANHPIASRFNRAEDQRIRLILPNPVVFEVPQGLTGPTAQVEAGAPNAAPVVEEAASRRPRVADSDHDGVPNNRDLCASTPADSHVPTRGGRAGCAPRQNPNRQ
ncbi:MAG: hypothetical protein IPJ69_04750 [Deltaproteobacteria bacterium]|nr:MAG: hypothetical protein IPJ69_04750 [Deltaproteobacteria bacterium]